MERDMMRLLGGTLPDMGRGFPAFPDMSGIQSSTTSQSVRTQIRTMEDGSVEERRTVRTHGPDGPREETSVTIHPAGENIPLSPVRVAFRTMTLDSFSALSSADIRLSGILKLNFRNLPVLRDKILSGVNFCPAPFLLHHPKTETCKPINLNRRLKLPIFRKSFLKIYQNLSGREFIIV